LILVAGAVLAVSATCTDDPAGVVPQAGTLTLVLATPNADDGALVFEVGGPPIDSATAASPSLRLFSHHAGGSTLVGVGAVASGPLVTLHVPDIGAAAEYSARVLDVADRRDTLRASISGYSVTVTR
jgi:hypothetical protein